MVHSNNIKKIIIYETFYRMNDLQDLLKTKQNYTDFLEETTKEDIPLPLEIKSKAKPNLIT